MCDLERAAGCFKIEANEKCGRSARSGSGNDSDGGLGGSSDISGSSGAKRMNQPPGRGVVAREGAPARAKQRVRAMEVGTSGLSVCGIRGVGGGDRKSASHASTRERGRDDGTLPRHLLRRDGGLMRVNIRRRRQTTCLSLASEPS